VIRGAISIIKWTVVVYLAAAITNKIIPEISAFVASLDRAGFTFGAVWGFVFGMGIVIIGYRIIYNHLVESDRRSDHAGVDKKHDARRI
jgi:hypothetical protein